MLALRTLPDPESLAESVSGQNRAAVARALNLLDDKRPEARRFAARLLATLPKDRLYGSGHLIGLTGPPGAGKSSLTSALISVCRERGHKVGNLAEDPSITNSGGAL